MNKSIFVRLLPIFVLLMPAFAVFANQLRELSLEAKVAKSDAVFIGRVISVQANYAGGDGRNEYSLVAVENSLKGRPSGTVFIESKGSISELNLLCCEVGANYLFFMQKAKNGSFISVNGPFGVYKLP